MKGIIVYKSKYGSTEAYAKWLRDESGFDLYDTKNCPKEMSSYDIVVIGSYIRAGRMALAGWIRSQWQYLQNKTVLLMLVNVTTDPDIQAKIVPQSLPAEIVTHIQVFPVFGSYMPSKMSAIDRTLIKMAASLTKDPKAKQELLSDRDLVDKENLKELLGCIQKFRSTNNG